MQQQGQFAQEDYFNNAGGINITDTAFVIKPEQATGGANFDYARTGGFIKRLGLQKSNSVADAQLKTMGLGLHHTKADVRTSIRAAGTKLQSIAVTSGTITNLTQDNTAVTSDFLDSSSTVPVQMNAFGTTTTDVLWCTGGGMSQLYGVYSSTKVTANGVPVPTGTMTATPTGAGSGTTLAAGTYYYAIAFHKLSTGATSNVVLDDVAAVVSTNDYVTIDLTGVSNIDATTYDSIIIYRSAIGGSSGFTVGNIVKTLPIATTTYNDVGNADEATSQNIARSGSIIVDNGVLPTGTYKFATVFKRRLITATNSTLYMSEVNKPESWPAFNYFQLPSGGDITGLAIISFTTPTSSSIDELLVIFKDNELWVVSGTGDLDADGIPDWSLKFIDNTGCTASQSIVTASGYLYWMNRRGFFLWDGAGKPIYLSRPIESLFDTDGQIDQSKLGQVWGVFNRKKNHIVWMLSHKTFGDMKFSLKLDLRLTLPSITQTSGERIIDGIFMQDTYNTALFAGSYQKTTGITDDVTLVGDDTGFVYKNYATTSDATAGIDFTYETSFLNQNSPGTRKTYHKVVVWVDKVGNWDLSLDYWTDYRTSEVDNSSSSQPISVGAGSNAALWDTGLWDTASWDDFTSQLVPIVFHLRSPKNNAVGDCIKLRFRQEGADEPIAINGFSVIYSQIGETK